MLVLVYNEEQLAQALRNPGYQAYLIAAGYEAGASAEAYLHRLEQRLNTQKTFPHEIGVFLGYPLEDILGFVLNGCVEGASKRYQYSQKYAYQA